ncbi:uncharacterized protein LOC144435656 [Glandiceps talaboti]
MAPTALPTEYIQLLARQRLPVQEPEVYSGDPIMFLPLEKILRVYGTGSVCSNSREIIIPEYRLRYVKDVETAYQEAWKELEERFGNPAVITSVIIQRLTSFAKFRADDNLKLLELADLCIDTVAHMEELPHLITLDTPHGMNPIVEKLPAFILNKWREKVSVYKQSRKQFPPFSYFTRFLKDIARTQNDPDIPKLSSSNTSSDRSRTSQQQQTTTRIRATKTLDDGKKCQFHDAPGHDLTECKAFAKLPISERINLCKKKGLCFKCTQKHFAKDCTTKLECTVCKSNKHLTCLHSTPEERAKQQEHNVKVDKSKTKVEDKQEATTKCTKLAKCPVGRSCRKIVLAKVYKQGKPTDYIETYVVIDDQSNAWMGDTQLFDALKINGPKLEYELSTCSSKELKRGRRGNNLILEAMNGKKRFPLPIVLENDNIPSDKNEIPTPEVCKAFNHQKPIADKVPELREDIGIHLLIGRNCPEPLKVRETRNGPINSPGLNAPT